MRAWEEFLQSQEGVLGKGTVERWLRPLTVSRFDACNLYLEASDSFQALWFEEHIRKKVEIELKNNNRKPIRVHLSVTKNPQKAAPTPKAANHESAPFTLEFPAPHNHATFSSFLTSPGNQLAFKLLLETCRSPLPSPLEFNPIYLYGKSGTGKSHLLMGGATALERGGLRVLYVPAETFTAHVVQAIRKGEMQAFRRAYRNVDALFVDNIEVFSRKAATQEEFFHTFNTLYTDGKLLVLSSSLLPQDLPHIEPRLISRFEWGIVLPCLMIDPPKMRELLLQRAELADFPLEEPLLAFLLDTFGHSTTKLVEALEALLLRTHLNQTALPLSPKIAEKTLADLIEKERKNQLTPAKILRHVAEHYGIRIEDILSKSQTRETTLPRQIAMHLCRQELKYPYMKIGDLFSRDHSTVIASIKQIQKGLDSKTPEIASPHRSILKTLS
ncbi:MAG: Chromosomal replication initiator protein DnaA [Chlamydiae bacterium]|nr:Chromosomal replication initiator protein DnaA [Chlamydiota bacterium]